MPIGPKCPLKIASRKFFTSGIHLYSAIMTGSRRKRMTKMPMTMSLQTLRERFMSEKVLNGVHAPTKTNAAMLNSRSITDEKTASSVCLLKKPSHAKAAPHENAARRSSVPRRVQLPIVSSASATYCAT